MKNKASQSKINNALQIQVKERYISSKQVKNIIIAMMTDGLLSFCYIVNVNNIYRAT